MQPPGKKLLRDIVKGTVDDFKQTWDRTEASEGFPPFPSGQYRCLIAGGEMFNTDKNSTPGYKVVFEVTTSPYAGRKFWHSIWLTDKALAMAKAELAKLGITRPEQLEQPLPPGMIADVKVVLRTNDDGDQFNRVKTFQVIQSEVPAADFAPPPEAPKTTPRETGDDDDDGDAWDAVDRASVAGGFNWESGAQSPPHTSNGAYAKDAPGRGLR
jgi:hypothetical protein